MDDLQSSSPSPSPLLHFISSPSQQQEPEPEEPLLLSLDDAIEHYIGKASFPLAQVLIVSCAWIFDAQQSFISVFSDKQPPWHCTHPDDTSCSTTSLPCSLPKTSWSWDNPKHASMISDWNLECSSTFIQGLPSSAYFAGCLAGGFILSTLSDTRLGRKNMLLLSSLAMSISSIISAASPNIWVYAVLRFITGFGRSTIGSSSLVLATEMSGRRWRGEVGAVCYIFFAFGFLSLPLMAYFTRESSWRNLYLFISVPCLCYTILLYFCVPESPRWLFVRGHTKKAIQILKKIGLTQDGSLDSNLINLNFVAKETCNMGTYSSLKMMWERKWAFWRMLTLVILGFGCGVAYYGMPLGVGTLGVNLYLSISFNAFVEILAALIIFFLIGKMKRKTSVVVFCMVSAVCSVSCVFLKMRSVRTAMEVVAFFATVNAFNVVLIYCMELFPTCLRNTAMSFTRQAVAFGCCVVPIMVAAGREHEFWSYGVFGFIIGGCGLFALYLPETKDKLMSDTLEEQEIMERGFLSS
ncbi:organic cation/carnitine transporter 2-like [Dioscorea cayenensis subsp. rotundata]|uniref:H(+)/Pi cotransporter n=1 Tax=Dioscorea cayennensis subsp. rotundata TaxID=55577 RepID=A0AB40BTF5_DIOCR|nr:organic cation/carnitine transporter 2-like [Dioscorea cayenensis subsp. rotundata]